MKLLAVLNNNAATLGSYTGLVKKPVNMTHSIGSVQEVYTDKQNRVVAVLDINDHYDFPLTLKIGTKNYTIKEGK